MNPKIGDCSLTAASDEDGELFVGTTVWLHQVPMFSVHVGQ